MAKASTKTPRKARNQKNKRDREKTESTILFLLIFAFLVLAAILFFYFQSGIFKNNTLAATLNGEEITIEDLEWWYKISIIPERAYLVSKMEFLENSLIPQEILIQKAREKNIGATPEEIENLIGTFLIENGLSIQDFEKNLLIKEMTIDDAKKSFEARAVILKFIEEESINDLDAYVNEAMKEADIRTFPENIDILVLRDFDETGDEICAEGKLVVRMYTTSWCDFCNNSILAFDNLIKNYIDNNEIIAFEWNLDTGDDLLTPEKERGIPKDEVEIFKRYSPKNLVPLVVIGCKYKRIGNFNYAHTLEFNDIMDEVLGE